MKIGIDIDDTIALTNSYILEEAIKYDKEYVEGRGFRNQESHKLNEKFYWRTENVNNFFQYIRDNHFYLNLEPREGASEYINKLYENKNKIIFITRRTKKSKKDTKKWLKEHGFKYNKIYFDIIDKGEKCKKLDIDLFIDDSEVHIYEAIANNIDTLLITTKRNKNNNKLPRVNDWKEIYEYIQKKV